MEYNKRRKAQPHSPLPGSPLSHHNDFGENLQEIENKSSRWSDISEFHVIKVCGKGSFGVVR